jgi:general secretion pathway protein D
MLDKAKAAEVTDEKYSGLWDINLEMREKLELPAEGEAPPEIETLFRGEEYREAQQAKREAREAATD